MSERPRGGRLLQAYGTRLRSAMPALTQLLAEFGEVYSAAPPDGQAGYADLLGGDDAPPYRMGAPRAEAAELMAQVVALGAALREAEERLARNRPAPASQPRFVPPD